MKLYFVNFANVDEVIKEHQLNINYSDIKENGSRNCFTQVSPSMFYTYLHGENSYIKLLFDEDQCFLEASNNLVRKVELWQKAGLLTNSSKVLDLLGFELLERVQSHLEEYETIIERLEEEVVTLPEKKHQAQILKLHRKAILLKKWLNEYLIIFSQCQQKSQIGNELIQSFQWELDNARQIIELLENLREAYQASVDNRLNDIMKFLTVLATILLPVNLLTSFWGMNFMHNMPLIDSPYGITVFFSLSFFIVGGFIIYLRKRKWV